MRVITSTGNLTSKLSGDTKSNHVHETKTDSNACYRKEFQKKNSKKGERLYAFILASSLQIYVSFTDQLIAKLQPENRIIRKSMKSIEAKFNFLSKPNKEAKSNAAEFKCPDCNRQYTMNKNQRRRHSNKLGYYECPTCLLTYSTKYLFRDHVKTHEMEIDEKAYYREKKNTKKGERLYAL